MTLRTYIRDRRLALGLSVRALATKLYIAHTTICEWEKGRRPVPRRQLVGLAEALAADLPFLRALWDADADARDAAALAKTRAA